MPRQRQHRLLLVTGCGRSGTRYASFVLRRLGLDVRHERLGADGIASWTMAVDAARTPWGPGSRGLSFDVVLHQVRHPLGVIASAATLDARSWTFIAEHTGCRPSDPPLVRAARYWCAWNEHAERRAALTYRVEALADAFEDVCGLLGVRPDRRALERVPRDVNTRRYRRAFHLVEEACERLRLDEPGWLRRALARPADPAAPGLTWEQLEAASPAWAREVRERACRYGYRA